MHLLQHFKELTVRPKNAQELKGLILQLAIQGKLTSKWRNENPNLEDASSLLKQIQREKELLIKDKKVKKETPLPKLKKDEIPFALPSGWVWTRLGNIGTTNVGLTYKPAHITNDGVPVLRSSNVQDGELCLNDLVRVNTNYSEKDIIKEGDLLICARNGSRRLVGKCTIIEHIDEVMVFGAFMAIFRSNFNPYLQLFIQSPQYRSKLEGVETTTINQITQGNLKATEVPLPPLEEQKAIVAVVETLFKEVEQLERLTAERINLKEKFAVSALSQLTTNNTIKEWGLLQEHFHSFFNEKNNIKKLRETVLQLAVQGKLTADWRANNPNIEDASVLLKRIKAEKVELIKEKKIKKETPLPAIAKDEIPYELPEGWVWCSVGDVSTIKGGKRIPKGYLLSDTATSHIYIRVTDMKNGSISFSKLKYITDDVYEIIKNYTISKDDLYITIAGTIGDVGIIPEELHNMNLTENAAKIVIYQIDRTFLKTLLNSHVCQSQFLNKLNQMAQPKLALHRIASTIIPLPPIEEQKAIVKKVNALMGLCDALENEVKQSQKLSEKLMQSVLREVFEASNSL